MQYPVDLDLVQRHFDAVLALKRFYRNVDPELNQDLDALYLAIRSVLRKAKSINQYRPTAQHNAVLERTYPGGWHARVSSMGAGHPFLVLRSPSRPDRVVLLRDELYNPGIDIPRIPTHIPDQPDDTLFIALG